MLYRRTKIVATIAPHTIHKVNGTAPDSTLNSSEVEKALSKLAESGVDVFRLNMSFRKKMGDEFIKWVFQWFKDHERSEAKDVTVLADLQGPKLRFGKIKPDEGITLEDGKSYKLYFKEDTQLNIEKHTEGNSDLAVVLLNDDFFRELGNSIRQGIEDQGVVEIGIGDGDTWLKVENEGSIKDNHIECKVSVGGKVKSGKGVMPKGISVEVDSVITDKDGRDLKFLLKEGNRFLSYIALSFVKHPLDILSLRKRIEEDKNLIAGQIERFKDLIPQDDRPDRDSILKRTLAPDIIAKIETIEAAKDKDTLNSIIDVADGVMVARGDLALQMNSEDVPGKQKEIIELCRLRGKPVITATQMLHSMEDHSRPTRAEVNDVFNAVMDGTDATMLSGETTNGKYPQEAVEIMGEVLSAAETYYYKCRRKHSVELDELSISLEEIISSAEQRLPDEENKMLKAVTDKSLRAVIRRIYDDKKEKNWRQSVTDMVCLSAWTMIISREIGAVIAATTSGRTARMLARYRPDIPIFGLTHDDENRRKLILSYGVYPLNIGLGSNTTEEMYESAFEVLKRHRYLITDNHPLAKENLVLTISGTPLGDPGTTNQLRLISLRERKLKLSDWLYVR
ncbi:hypothetical protein CEE37_14680 [candidate division LCP-89 bacterium B3_LCP]|uniref:pyruvate kinase n=1 Tax=candidate division LCP-89 bacterium B3_LCP TaxID=2012998 RepID=A0A532UPH3_UNCL8|nr:MAG: hypothetical protein CEE37_14680 [candidate division LCP-89 bacterium B3_LCP]